MAEVRQLPDEKRHNWIEAYEFWTGGAFPSRRWGSQFDKWIDAGLATHELIVAVMEKGLQRKVGNFLGWTHEVMTNLVPFGVTTPAEWEQHQKDQAETAERQIAQRESDRRIAKVKAGPTAGPSTTLQAYDAEAILRR